MRELSRSKKHLESIFDSITYPIFTVNHDYQVTRLNKSFEVKTGKSFQDILLQKCYAQLYKRDTPCPRCPLQKVLTEGATSEFKIEVEGNIIYKVNCFPLKEKDDEVIAMVEVADDISEDEQVRREFSFLEEQIFEKSVLLAKKNDDLKAAYQKISQELELARQVQRGIMPTGLPNVPELETAVLYLPMEEVGGDLYDFIHITSDSIGIIMADISGHGIPAAFIAAMAKMSFYLHSLNNKSTAKVLSQVNQDMCDNLHTDEFFFTTSFCLIDLLTNTIKYSNAGHPPLIILKDQGAILEKVNDRSIIMGINEDAKYFETKIDLKKGDRLVFYTDGIFETISMEKEDGFRQFCELLQKTAHLDAKSQVKAIHQEVLALLDDEPPQDDITLVIVDIALENKYKYFKLKEESFEPQKATINAIRHPLDFDKAISSVLHSLDTYFFHDQEIRNSKFAIYEALNLFFRSRLNSDDPIYIVYTCTKEKCRILLVDNRFLEKGEIPRYYEKPEYKDTLDIIKKHMHHIEFIDGGKKLLLEKRNV